MAQSFFYLYVFFTGATVMGVEMCASKLAAPYFGTSMIVWANIIGVILLAMSLGYWVGGKLADRYPTTKLLFSLTLGAGVLVSLIPLITRSLFSALTGGIFGTPIYLIVLTFAGTLLVFTPPIFIVAMATPFVLRIWAPSTGETGKVVGRLNAFSTLGSLLGTFLPSLLLIPLWGTRATIYVLAFLLMAVSAWGLKKWWAMLLVLLPLILLIFNSHTIKAAENVLWEKETAYQYVQVVRQQDDSIALVYNEGGGYQSILRPGKALVPSDYYDYYLVLPFFNPRPDYQTWILGSAGGTMLGLFDHYVRPDLPGLKLTGVEIDPDVIPLGERFFGLTGREGTIVNADARIFLNSAAPEEKADLVIVDAYTQQIYIPPHLSTVEFYQQVKDHLSAGGMLALNLNALSPSSPILLAFQNTLRSVFAYTYVLPVPNSLNYVLLASDTPVNPAGLEEMPAGLSPYAQYFSSSLTPVEPGDGLILTDDRAPVDFLTDEMIWEGLQSYE